MRSTTEQPNFGIAIAHPDDQALIVAGVRYLQKATLVPQQRQPASFVSSITCSYGRKSTLCYDPNVDVAGGGRLTEDIATHAYLGAQHRSHLDYPDGELIVHRTDIARRIMREAQQRNLSLFVTLGELNDHPDHRTTALAARDAACLLAEAGHDFTLFELQAQGVGRFVIGSEVVWPTEIMEILHRNPSQYQMVRLAEEEEPPAGHQLVSPGFAMNDASYKNFIRYPMFVEGVSAYNLWTPQDNPAWMPGVSE